MAGERCSTACGYCGRCDAEPEPRPFRPANRLLDDAVRTQHAWDAHQVDRILEFLMTMPRKVEAKRFVEDVFHKVRLNAVQCPELVLEMEVRKQLAAQDDPDVESRAMTARRSA